MYLVIEFDNEYQIINDQQCLFFQKPNQNFYLAPMPIEATQRYLPSSGMMIEKSENTKITLRIHEPVDYDFILVTLQVSDNLFEKTKVSL